MPSRTRLTAAILAAACTFGTAGIAAATPVTPQGSTAPGLGSSANGSSDGTVLGGSSVTQDSLDGAGSNWFGNTADLAGMKPGQVIDTRTILYHYFGIPTPVPVQQIKFRTTNALGQASYGITSIMKPAVPQNGKVVSFHSVYDSLNPDHAPSRAIAGDVALGTVADNAESTLLLPFLAQGYTVAVTDIEGPEAHFAAGPKYGMVTLDALRAAMATPETGLRNDAPIGLFGYSGGAIATNWAAALAPSYAPEVNKNLVGSATGGVLVDPEKNIQYVNGSEKWSGILPFTLLGVARAYQFDLQPYLSDYGKLVMSRMEHAVITEVYPLFNGITWDQLFKPEYREPRSIPGLADALNKINLGFAPTPTSPMFIGEADNGEPDGTAIGGANIGSGDGVMVTGDVRALAHRYCDAGQPVTYHEYKAPFHVPGFLPFYLEGTGWLLDRFNGKPAPSDCATIPQGNTFRKAEQVPPGPGASRYSPTHWGPPITQRASTVPQKRWAAPSSSCFP